MSILDEKKSPSECYVDDDDEEEEEESSRRITDIENEGPIPEPQQYPADVMHH